jgi:DNA (cytosine-5)-methyltransferase 1
MKKSRMNTKAEWLTNFNIAKKKSSAWIREGLKVLGRNDLKINEAISENPHSYSTAIGLGAIGELENWRPRLNIRTTGLINVIDMFSGCGGMSLGFDAVSTLIPSFNVIGALDINHAANSTYETNFRVKPKEIDIRQLAHSAKKSKSFLHEYSGYSAGAPLVLIGCAPCQGFTSHRKKMWSKKDFRNSLIVSFALVAKHLKPDVILMENVPEMHILMRAGYTVRQGIYNSAAFGVPQERHRAVVIAMRRPFSMPSGFLSAAQYITVREAIGKLPPIKPGEKSPEDPMHFTATHREETIETIRRVPKNGGSRPKGVGPKCLDRVKGYYDVYGRLFWDKPSITLTHYARNPASGRYVHPEQNRGLSVRETALLQSFPNKFVFEGTFDEKFSQIGNAVPPRFSSFIASHILCELATEGKGRSSEPHINDVLVPVSSSFSSVIAGMKVKRGKNEKQTAGMH